MRNRSWLCPTAALGVLLLCSALLWTAPVVAQEEEQHNCRMMGVISTQVPADVIQGILVTQPNSLENLSPSNDDGWSIAWYPDGESEPVVYRGEPAANADPAYNVAADACAAATPRIALGHVRSCSSGLCDIPDPHNFHHFKGGRHWLLGHNGHIDKAVLVDLIRPDYFAANPPQNGTGVDTWIDSELYMIFIMQTLEDFNFQVKPALGYAIRVLRDRLADHRLNFYLSDGANIWGYREGTSLHPLHYLYNTVGTTYSAVASQYPSASQGNWVAMPNGMLVTLYQNQPPDVEMIEEYFGDFLLTDNYFDESASSEDLRNPGGWYESRGDAPALVTLNTEVIDGNGGAKAAFAGSTTSNVYLSQAFDAPQIGIFSVQWNVYVDEIVAAEPYRTALMLIGDDSYVGGGPNANNSERFVYLGFERPGGSSGTMNLVARDRDDAWTAFTQVATDLYLDQWYTIKVVCNLDTDMYDVYLDDVYQATVSSRIAKDVVTHISFAQWNDGAGSFYIDNVLQSRIVGAHTLTLAVDPSGGGVTDPAEGSHMFMDGDLVNLMAYANAGYEFDYWSGNVANAFDPSTYVLMDQDQLVTAHFRPLNVEFLVDNVFDEATGSQDLRDNAAGQDWYESRGDDPSLLTLSTVLVGGNASPKAMLSASTTGNVYLTQEFGLPATGTLSLQWDIYVDEILDQAPYRSGMMLVGDDAVVGNGPNAANDERFVYMGFYRDGGGTTGTMDLVARDRDDAWLEPTLIMAGLSLDHWYTIRVDLDFSAGTYDVYVDGTYRATVSSRVAKTTATHISFAQWNDGAGTYYVDNVYHIDGGDTRILHMAVDPLTGGSTTPAPGTHVVPGDVPVTVSAIPTPGMVFDRWTGEVADPYAATTSVFMDGDQYVTAHFRAGEGVAFAEDFEDGFTAGVDVGDHAEWFDSDANTFGPDVTPGAGVAGSIGLLPGGRVFTWTAHPFSWNGPDFVGAAFQMDFSTDASGYFREDRVGWMIEDTSTEQTHNFGFDLWRFGSNVIIRGYWENEAGSRRYPQLCEGPVLPGNTWYRLRAEVTRLDVAAASVVVSLEELDAAGNPIGVVCEGEIANTSLMGTDAPASKYFTAPTQWASFKNYGYPSNGDSTRCDNAVLELITAEAQPHALTVNVTGGGAVVVNPDQLEYFLGDVIELTAIPEPGWTFSHWSGHLSGAANPGFLVCNGDMSVTATFVGTEGPAITSTPVTEGQVGYAYTYDVNATGLPAPTYALTVHPTGMEVNAVSGVITWTPAATGPFDVEVAATNVLGTATQAYQITVTELNVAPVLAAIGNRETTEHVPLQFAVSATDANSSTVLTLTMASSDLPSGLFTDNGNGTGAFSWTPGAGLAGTYHATFVASDGLLNDSEEITITVNPAVLYFLADNGFEAASSSEDLRANGGGQDWYESRAQDPGLLTLNTGNIGGNATPKAAFAASSTTNAYLTQEFGSAQTGTFAVQWDIYVDQILDISAPDRAGVMLIGDDAVAGSGPNAANDERFVYLAFFRNGGGISGTMDLVARDRDDAWTAFTTVATGLNLDQWYTIKVVCNLGTDTYDVYLNDVFRATLTSRMAKSVVTHISFAQWNDASGAFFVDNVMAADIPVPHTLTMAVNPSEGGTTTPAVGAYTYYLGDVVDISATAAAGYRFDHWAGDVINPTEPSTTVAIDADKTVTAHFVVVGTVSTIAGTVTSDGLGMDGLVVTLSTGGAELAQTITAAGGLYEFAELPAGEYTVDLSVPLNYAPASEPSVTVTLAGTPVAVDFSVAVETIGSRQTLWWWEIYIEDLRTGGSRPDVFTVADIEGWASDIFEHYYQRPDDHAIQMMDVTYSADPVRPHTFDDLCWIFLDDPDNSYEVRIRRNLLACMLNIASNRMGQLQPATEDGVTVTQAIVYYAQVYQDNVPWQTVEQRNLLIDAGFDLRDILYGRLLAAGSIPLSTPTVLFKPDGDTPTEGLLPTEFALSQNYPNPFNPTTRIDFTLPTASHARLDIFNVLGQKVTTLIDENLPAGYHTVDWDAGKHSSGIYFFRLHFEKGTLTRKAILVQ